MIRLRFDERECLFTRIRSNSEFISDDDIYQIVDEFEWCDLTFIFDERPSGYIKTVVIDNVSGCDVALDDLNPLAKDFYLYHLNKLSRKNAIEKIRRVLYEKVV